MALSYYRLSFLPQVPLIGLPSRTRLRTRAVEAISFLVFFVGVGLCLAALASASDDDDQALRFTAQSGPFLVAVFGQPGDLPPGHSDFGILVQDRNTQDIDLHATVDLTVVADSDTPGPSSTARVVPANAENKLLQTAELDLPTEGNWKMYVSVKRNSETAGLVLPIHVARQRGALEHLNRWPYIAHTMVGAVLLIVYVRRHRTARSEISSVEPKPLLATGAQNQNYSSLFVRRRPND